MALRFMGSTAGRRRAAARLTTQISPASLGTAAGLGLMILALPGAAQAQSVGSRIDQPTPATLPPGTHPSGSSAGPAHQPTGQVAPPSAISSSTDVIQSGPVQGHGTSGKVDPIQHLPKTMQR